MALWSPTRSANAITSLWVNVRVTDAVCPTSSCFTRTDAFLWRLSHRNMPRWAIATGRGSRVVMCVENDSDSTKKRCDEAWITANGERTWTWHWLNKRPRMHTPVNARPRCHILDANRGLTYEYNCMGAQIRSIAALQYVR